MITYIVGAVVALAFVGLLGMWYERGSRIKSMNEAIVELNQAQYAANVRADVAEKSEKDLRMMIDQFNGRPFHVGLSDAQVLTLAQIIMSAMPNVKATQIQ
jgi:hypothetical protein